MRELRTLFVLILASVLIVGAGFAVAFGQRANLKGGSKSVGVRSAPSEPAPLDPFARKAEAERARERAAGASAGTAVDARSDAFATPTLQAGEGATDVLRLKDGRTFELVESRLSGRTGVEGRLSDGGDPARFSTSEVESLEIAVSTEFRRGLEAYDAGRLTGSDAELRQALDRFQGARKSARGRLEKEWATAKIAETLQRLGRGDEAAAEFFLLCRLDPMTSFLSSAPLRWTLDASRGESYDPSASRHAEALALEWIKPVDNPTGKANPSGRLLAASILLEFPSRRKEAQEALRALATLEASDDASHDEAESARRIALLAIAQLWRLDALGGPKASLVDRWTKTTELLPESLRRDACGFVGLMELNLGRDEALGRVVRSAASVADRDLARACGVAAADACRRLGRADEERELRRRFGGSATRGASF